MNISLYKFAKKENSTAIPSGDDAYTINVVLKDDTDILHPVFELVGDNFVKYYNYCSCVIWGYPRYYFINKIEYISKALVHIYCDIDVLATWKPEITASTQYVVRSSDATQYTAISTLLNDSVNPTIVGALGEEADKWDLFDLKDGYYSVGINARGISAPYAKRGSVSYVIMSKADLNDFITDLFTLTGDSADLSPIQYISSCVYIPYTFTATDFLLQTDSNVIIGNSINYDMPLTYRQFNPNATPNLNDTNGLIIKQHDVTIPDHYQLANFGAYLNYEPYCKGHIVGGVLGDFDLPLSIIPRKVRYIITLDQTDGTANFELCNQYLTEAGKKTYLRIACQIGVPIALVQSATMTTMDKYRVYTSLASSLGSALTLNVGQSIRGFSDAIMNAHEGNIPKISSNGVNGSLASLKPIITMFYSSDVAQADVYHVGKPIFKSITLSTLAAGSFVKCRNPLISIYGLLEEQRMIRTFLEEGIYLD